MNGKLLKNIGFSLLPIAFLFLFEPGYTILDPLPDFLGYIILCLAIINLADINPRIADALSGFRKGIIISISRLVSIYLLNRFFVADEQTVGLLLFTFVFAFFELVVLIPAFRQFFEGLLSLGMHHNGTAVYLKKIRKKTKIDAETGKTVIYVKESHKNITEKACVLTSAFLIVRAAAMTLPEFTTLISNSSYEFVKLLRFFGFIIVLPLGIVWLVKMLSYCAKIRKDSPFIRELSDHYLNYTRENPNFYTVRTLSMTLYTLIVAFVLSADFYSDYINMIPDLVFYTVLIVAAIFARSSSKKWRPLLIISVVGFVFNAISHYMATDFHTRFYPAAIRKNLEAYNAFYRMASFYIIDSVILIAATAAVILILWDVFKSHTDISLATDRKEYVYEKSKFIKGAVPTLFFSLLAAVGNVYFVFSQPFNNSEKWIFYYSNIISVLISLLLTFSAVYFVGYINSCIKYRYRLDI